MGTEDFIALPASGDFGHENESNESLSFNETREASSQSSVLECKDNPASIEKVELADDVQLQDMRCIPQSDLNDETQCSESDMEIEDLNNLPDLSKTRSTSENYKIRSEAEYLPVNSVDENILPSIEPLQQNELHLRSEDVSHAESKKIQKDLVDNSSFSKTSGLLTLATGVSIENGSAPSHHHGGPRKIHKSDAILGVKKPRMAMDEQQPSVHIVYTSLTRDSKQKLDELLKQWSEWNAQRGSPSQGDRESENLESGEETFFPALCVGTKKTSAVTFWIDNQTSEQPQNFVPIDDNSVPLYDRGFTLGLTSANDSIKTCDLSDPEDEDQPSGITIYADEKGDEQEDGEITEPEYRKPGKKMSVEFPGINAPIPESADERLWSAEPLSSDLPRKRSSQRLNHHIEHDGRGNDHHQQRWSRDYRDYRPPGVDSVKSPTIFTPRYGGHESSYGSRSPRDNFSTSRSQNLGRLHSDRGRKSPRLDDDYSRYGSYSSSPFSPPRRR
ncbi:hypothetical protein SDJN03_22959, partial [Cucurbita argyrosperma subsp. sororia]